MFSIFLNTTDCILLFISHCDISTSGNLNKMCYGDCDSFR